MRNSVLSGLFCLFSAISLALASDVLEFTDDNFESSIGQHDVILVEFFAPWCGHCKALAPKYEEAATILKKNDPPVSLAKVDCIEGGKASCEKYEVRGYPTLKIFRNGEYASEYNGGRDISSIVKYMKSQVGPASKELKSLKEVETFTGASEVVAIGFFEDETSNKKDAFLKFADKHKEQYKFGHTFDKDVLKKYNFEDDIVLFRPKHLQSKFEDIQVVYKGKPDSNDLKAWVKENFHGIVGYKTRDNAEDFSGDLVTGYYKVDYVKNVKGTNYWRNRILKVATEFKGKLNFAIANKDEFVNELNEYGIDYTTGEKPVITAKVGGLKYVMKDEFSVETFKTFLEQLVAGKLEAYLKSEPIPEDNDQNPVKVAVGKNFKELITDSGKDALIEFYAPWCGHCKKLAPIYDELGKELKDEPGVVIAKMDATANDVPPEFEVHGFPTIYFLPRGGSPVKYQGEREVKGFIKYIAEKATDELQTYDRSGKKKKSEL